MSDQAASSPWSGAGDDHEVARQVADVAGLALLGVRADRAGAAPDVLRREADMRSHEVIIAALAAARPGDAVLSEEGVDNKGRLSAARVWIVDPLDGTREFAEPGRADWAVHVALVVGGTPVAAAVALPARKCTLGTRPPARPPVSSGRPTRLVVSRTRPPPFLGRLRSALDADVEEMGSAGAKAMCVVLGEADVYVHTGGQYEWDSAAPVGVAAAAGLHVSRLDGSALRYNQADPWLPDVLICRQELAVAVVAAARDVA